jgi:hypothetical protein
MLSVGKKETSSEEPRLRLRCRKKVIDVIKDP